MKQVSTYWTESSDSFSNLRAIRKLSTLFGSEGGEVGLRIVELIRDEDYKGLLNFEIDYTLSWDVNQLICCRQALAFFQKNESLDVGIDRESVAYAKFLESEDLCSKSNAIFRALRAGTYLLRPSDNLLFQKARSLIRKVLGNPPNIEDLRLRFGPGATASVKRTRSSPCFKLAELPSCSLDLLASGLLPSVYREMPGWVLCHSTADSLDDSCDSFVVETSITQGRLQFVPKNAKTYRAIDTQPTINTMVQAGIGDFMLKRLASVGVDLKDQSLNQRLACKGSTDGSLATIDLSSASDTISTQLVKYLLPEGWYRLLASTRCGSTTYQDKTIVLEKFCAMGNGFTFPLESLIFWALAKAAIGANPDAAACRTLSVYGDDIICPTWAYERVCRILSIAGFLVNTEKSFSTGGFRESCGGDYYHGINVRPFYLRKVICGRTLFTMHNFFFANYRDDVCKIIVDMIPKSLRLFGPEGYGDGHLHAHNFPLVYREKERRKGYGGAYFSTYALVGRKVPTPFYGDFVTPLYSIYMKERSAGCPTINWWEQITEPLEFLRDGRVLWPLPGDSSGVYEKKQVYTFLR